MPRSLDVGSATPWRVVLTLLLGAGVAGCDRELGPGDSCTPTDARCLGAKTELACQAGVLISAPCKGPKGCRESGGQLLCDISENAEGDPCSTADEGNAQCRTDRTALVRCTGGAYQVLPCRGNDACRDADPPVCDQSLAKDGDRCMGSGHACSMDEKTLLRCSAGRFEAEADCAGDQGCRFVDTTIQCDQRNKGAEATTP